ncbi:MAG: hypothetical protein F4X65_13395 [Chloroflexi bacterium]|nr:hypothetical protein [Chloroflexota bacterium]
MWQIYGQDHLTRQLDAAIKVDRLSHAYLLVGPPHVGKMSLAINMAQAVNCLAGESNAARQPAPERSLDLEPAAGLFALDDATPGPASNRLLENSGQYASGPGEEVPSQSGDVPCGDCSQCQRVAQGLHSDVRIIGVGTGDDENVNRRDIRIEQVRDIESFLNLTPYEGVCKVVVVDGAELMNTAAANALLKTLEEPPGNSLLLLLTASEDALLPTIRSRCSALYLKPAAKSELQERLTRDYNADPELAERVARISRGCIGQAVNALRDPEALEQREADLQRLQEVCEGGLDMRFDYAAELATRFNRDRDAAKELLYLWLRWWRDLLLIKEGAEEYLHNYDHVAPLRLQATRLTTGQVTAFIKRLNRTLEALDANANPRLTLEVLMLGLPLA